MNTKSCAACQLVKPVSEFTWTKRAHRDGRKDCYHPYCNPCRVQKHKDWVAANPERHRQHQLRRRLKNYGISVEQYDAWMAAGCAICHTTERRLVIDHCHQKGQARGVLCAECNAGLGMFNDNVERMIAAITYLEASK